MKDLNKIHNLREILDGEFQGYEGMYPAVGWYRAVCGLSSARTSEGSVKYSNPMATILNYGHEVLTRVGDRRLNMSCANHRYRIIPPTV